MRLTTRRTSSEAYVSSPYLYFNGLNSENTGEWRVDNIYTYPDPDKSVKICWDNPYWYYRGNDLPLDRKLKSMYDPCPVGWYVPDGATFSGLSNPQNASHGMYYPLCITSVDNMWLPHSGFLYQGYNFFTTSTCLLMSSSPNGSGSHVSPFNGWDSRAYAKPVRCIQE